MRSALPGQHRQKSDYSGVGGGAEGQWSQQVGPPAGWGTHLLAPLSFRAATYSGVITLLPMLTGEGRAHHGEIMREATRLCEAGKIAPKIDLRRFTLETVGDAYRAIKMHDTN